MRVVLPAVLSVVSLCTPAAAQWKDFVLPELGAAVQFPGTPKREAGRYQTQVVGSDPAPAEIVSLEQDDILYRLTVVDLRAPEYVAKSANILAECVFFAEDEGMPLVNVPLRVEDGTAHGARGRSISVDIPEKLSRKETSCVFARGYLYELEAEVRREHGEPDTPLAPMFTSSLRLDMRGN